jgi:hypothetical protein
MLIFLLVGNVSGSNQNPENQVWKNIRNQRANKAPWVGVPQRAGDDKLFKDVRPDLQSMSSQEQLPSCWKIDYHGDGTASKADYTPKTGMGFDSSVFRRFF